VSVSGSAKGVTKLSIAAYAIAIDGRVVKLKFPALSVTTEVR
jgi:hypothetical protein